jgi:hypothetical protein
MTVNNHTVISLFHILVTGPVFVYLAMKKYRNEPISTTWSLGLMVFLGIAWLYLLSKLWTYYKLTGSVTSAIQTGWIYSLHVLVIVPLLAWVLLLGNQLSSSVAGFTLFSIGSLAIVYHLFKLFMM